MRQSIFVALLVLGIATFTAPSAWSQTSSCPLAGTVKMNFDAISIPPGSSADGVAYLNSFGIAFTPLTPTVQPLIYNVTGQAGIASSAPNVLFVTPPSLGPVSYLFGFCAPLRSISFTRGGIDSCCISAAWAARALDANGVEVASVYEPARTGDRLPQRFTLTGENIRAFRFEANNSTFVFNHPPFDDFILDAGVTDNQSRSHVFAQIVDGVSSDASFYRSTFLVSSDNPDPVTCTATLGGLTIPGFGDGSTRAFTIAAGGWSIIGTPGTQPLRAGYATLTCNAPVVAQVLYSAYSAAGVLLSQATVFPSPNAAIAQLIADQSNGAQLGMAIANTGTAPTEYVIRAVDQNGTEVGRGGIQIPGRAQAAKFLSELIAVPAGFVGRVLISTNPANVGNVYAIGLRFTGSVFTTIPVTTRSSQ